MSISYIIKGGSKCLDHGNVDDSAVLELHAVVKDNAVVRGTAVVARSTICDDAVVRGTSHVRDAYVGGDTILEVERIGRNGHIESNEHCLYLRIRGEGYTIHRTHSEVKGFGAQVVDSTGTKITENKLKSMVAEHAEFRTLQYAFNMLRKEYQKA